MKSIHPLSLDIDNDNKCKDGKHFGEIAIKYPKIEPHTNDEQIEVQNCPTIEKET